jgi:serine/threonine protein kinase
MNRDTPLDATVSAADRIDELCDAFENAWQRGERPRIDAFLAQAADGDWPELFYQLLLVDLEYRGKSDERLSREFYLREFPRFAAQIEAVAIKCGNAAFASSTSADAETVQLRINEGGQRVGQFELQQRLGAGAMGEVWKAWDPRLQRAVAIKLPRSGVLSEADLHRFLREGRAAAQLRHPRLSSVHEVGHDGDKTFIVTDYVEGINLKQYLATNRLHYRAIAKLCAEIAEALHHAHEHGVVHRDLKPANIVVDPAGQPHVIDFGLAKWSSDERDLTLKGDLLGTPAYMSPEQATGNSAKVGPASDVYALGVILYEMLAGRCPFTGEFTSVIHQIPRQDPPPLRAANPTIPRDLETVCLKALEKSPQRRYTTAQEMAEDLRRFERGEPVAARPVGRIEKTWRWIHRRPALAASLTLLATVAVATWIVAELREENYRLQGYRPVRITSRPAGASVALVPIDERSGEPNPDPAGIIRPDGTMPQTVWIKPGRYFVEAVWPGEGDLPDFTETYWRMLRPDEEAGVLGDSPAADRLRESPFLDVHITQTKDVVADMVRVPIDEDVRRQNPLLPEVLYVDPKESVRLDTSPPPEDRVYVSRGGIPERRFTWDGAREAAGERGKRLPSAAEYDAIAESVRRHQLTLAGSGAPAEIEDLDGGAAEWTTTRHDTGAFGPGFKGEFYVLKGFDELQPPADIRPDFKGPWYADRNTDSPKIGYRGVRSGAPRFVKP